MNLLLLLGVGLLLVIPARGQHLLKDHNYQVYKVEVTHFNGKTHGFDITKEENVSYYLASAGGIVQVRQYHPRTATMGELWWGKMIFQLTSMKYIKHKFDPAKGLSETYLGYYKAYSGQVQPPGLPNPSAVEIYWFAGNEERGTLEVNWLFGSKKDGWFNRSSYTYRFYYKQLE